MFGLLCSTVSLALAEGNMSHWAFQPIRSVEMPQLPGAPHPIDAFVRESLGKADLEASPRADSHTLIRRLHLDLTGLPPTLEEVIGFVDRDSPEEIRRVIQKLLASPTYGEHWGRHWLDVARYSDAKGYVDAGETRYPFAYTYRDYVIKAFNEDLPFDQFIRDQIAADRLDTAANEAPAFAALGFLTVGSRYNFFPHEIIDDRIDVVTRGFLGLTVTCARCHDHKFDPISAQDYYSLYSIFANSYEPTPDKAPLLAPASLGENEAFLKKLTETAMKNTNVRRKLHDRMCHEMRAWAGDYLRYIVQTTPEHRTEAQPRLRTERGLIREFSAYASGGVIRWRRFLASRTGQDPVWGLWSRLARSTREEIPSVFATALTEWSAGGTANPIVEKAFETASVRNLADAADAYSALLEPVEAQWRSLLEKSPETLRFEDPAEEQLRLALYGHDAPGSIPFGELEDVVTLDESVEVRKLLADIERVFLEDWHGVTPRPMLLQDKPQIAPQRIFLRGDATRPGKLAPRVIPSMITGAKPAVIREGSGRLELARAIADPRHPLTARVIVNRVWAWHFGQGLVTTPSDFGLRSAPPSHPGLLDYLSKWLIDHDWSLKKLHRFILTSHCWQQCSLDRPAARHLDSENRLLWRANRQRLPLETMRDSMLSAAGRLQSRGGGPPIEKAIDDPTNPYRTLYSYIDREKLAEVYRVFDFPSPDISAPKRGKTTVPQQALFFLNNPFVIAQATALAKDVDGRHDAILALYQRILTRSPNKEEHETAKRFLQAPAASLTQLAQALLVSNEFLFMD